MALGSPAYNNAAKIPMSILSVRHLAKTYRSRRVVKDVSLTVHSGEIIGLLGPNGAGKTTSFYMIIGLVASEGGSIHLDSDELTRLPLDLDRLMYAEGGPEAQLYVHARNREYEFVGRFDSPFDDGSPYALPVPNVIGIVRRE